MKKQNSCPNCGAGLVFRASTRNLVCEHCGGTFNIPAPARNTKLVRKYTEDFEFELNSRLANTYMCANCGTSHTVQDGKVSKRCPSCGSTNVSSSSAKLFCPDGIIPFELDKQEAQQIFLKWIKKRKFAPEGLVHLAKQGKITQMYVPVYNFNATCFTAYNAIVKKVHTDKSSDTIFSTTYTLRDVDSMQIKDDVYSANSRIDSETIKNITQIDTSKIVPYSSEYLLGYAACDTNCSIHQCFNDLSRESSKESEAKLRAKLKSKYDDIDSLQCNSRLRNVTFNYTYIPVFVNHYTYGKKEYHCYIGGVNGKVSGKSPKSATKVLALTLGALGVVALGIFLLAKLVF